MGETPTHMARDSRARRLRCGGVSYSICDGRFDGFPGIEVVAALDAHRPPKRRQQIIEHHLEAREGAIQGGRRPTRPDTGVTVEDGIARSTCPHAVRQNDVSAGSTASRSIGRRACCRPRQRRLRPDFMERLKRCVLIATFIEGASSL